MKKDQILTGIFALIFISFLYGVQGQYESPQTGDMGLSMPYPSDIMNQAMQYPSDYNVTPPSTITPATVPQYSQYYTMGSIPSTHVSAPRPIALLGKLPITVYFGSEQQAVPYSQYRSDIAFTSGNSLWIQGPSSWTQYARVPVGASLSLLAISPTGGSGYVNELDPNGKTNTYNYYFYPTSTLNFFADSPGRHAINFVIGDKPSNQVVIDVEGGIYTAPSYYKPPYYYNGYYYPYYDWWGWGWSGFVGTSGTGGTSGGATSGTGGGTGGTGGGTGAIIGPGQSGEHGAPGVIHGQAGEHGQGAERSAAARSK